MTGKRLKVKPVVIRTAITLRPGEDDDLIAAFAKVPARRFAVYIKTAMRSGALDAPIDGLPDDSELAESLGAFLL